MTYDLVILNGYLTDSSGVALGDVGIKNGKIAAIGDLSSSSSIQLVDARGLTVMPGLIDTQVHFREPGLEHKEDLESGTRAALFGGVTSVLEMPNTQPNTVTAEALSDKMRRAEGRAWCNFGFFVGASVENIDTLGELEKLPGTPGVKIFMGSSTGSLLVADDDDLRNVLYACEKRCPIHAEDERRNRVRKQLVSSDPHPREHPFLRDAESAILATQRILRLSKETAHSVHILHVSTLEEPALIADGKAAGLGCTSEVTPQHLYFAAPECYDRLGTLVQMNPPIRSAEHRDGLWKALYAGVFDVFGSDHAPHTLAEKALPYPNSPSGMPGVQTMLQVLLTFASQGRLDLSTIVRMACEKPADLYGIQGKGKLQVGFDADLILVDPEMSFVFERGMVQSKCGWSPYEGERLCGSIEYVILGGEIALASGALQGSPAGRMLHFD